MVAGVRSPIPGPFVIIAVTVLKNGFVFSGSVGITRARLKLLTSATRAMTPVLKGKQVLYVVPDVWMERG
jgi:hypothetical protein